VTTPLVSSFCHIKKIVPDGIAMGAAWSNASSPARRRCLQGNEEALELYPDHLGTVRLLAEELAANTTLKELTVIYMHREIGDDAAVALAGALATNRTLKILTLPQNEIGDVGLVALGQALAQNDSLEVLARTGFLV
jgi:hypothetical protein